MVPIKNNMEKMMPISLFLTFIDKHLDGNFREVAIEFLNHNGIKCHRDDGCLRRRETAGGSLHQIPGNDISQADRSWRGGLSNK